MNGTGTRASWICLEVKMSRVRDMQRGGRALGASSLPSLGFPPLRLFFLGCQRSFWPSAGITLTIRLVLDRYPVCFPLFCLRGMFCFALFDTLSPCYYLSLPPPPHFPPHCPLFGYQVGLNSCDIVLMACPPSLPLFFKVLRALGPH